MRSGTSMTGKGGSGIVLVNCAQAACNSTLPPHQHRWLFLCDLWAMQKRDVYQAPCFYDGGFGAWILHQLIESTLPTRLLLLDDCRLNKMAAIKA